MFQSWQNVDLEMPIVMGTITVCLWIVFKDTAGQDTVIKLYRCVAEIEMKAEFEDRCVVLMGQNINNVHRSCCESITRWSLVRNWRRKIERNLCCVTWLWLHLRHMRWFIPPLCMGHVIASVLCYGSGVGFKGSTDPRLHRSGSALGCDAAQNSGLSVPVSKEVVKVRQTGGKNSYYYLLETGRQTGSLTTSLPFQM